MPRRCPLAITVAIGVLITFLSIGLVVGAFGKEHSSRKAGTRPDFESWEVEPTRDSRTSSTDVSPGTDDNGRTILDGFVREAGSDRPVAGARVFVINDRQRVVATKNVALTDEEGRFQIRHRGEPGIGVIASGFMPRSRLLSKPETTEPLIIHLERGAAVAGVVIDDSGSPLSKATVWCCAPENRLAWPNSEDLLPVPGIAAGGGQARTDDRGRFEIRGLAVDQEYVVRARLTGYSFPDLGAPPEVAPGDRDVRLELVPTYTLLYRATDARTGRALEVADIRVRVPSSFRVAPESVISPTADSNHTKRHWTGLALVSAGRTNHPVTVRASAPGFDSASREIALSPGLNEAEVALPPLDSRTAFGSVVLEAAFSRNELPYDGALVIEVYTKANRLAGRGLAYFEEGRGKAPLRLAEGRYTIVARGNTGAGDWWQPASRKASIEIRAGRPTHARLELLGTRVDLEVRDPEGRPVYGYDLNVNASSGPMGTRVYWNKGPGSAPNLYLPPGPSILRATMPGVGTGVARIVGGSEPVSVEIRLGR